MAARTTNRRRRGGNVPESSAIERPRGGSPAAPEPPPKADQLLTFFAAGHEYAISILHVREIAEYRALTPVPGTPAWIRGVMNLRGTVVPAIDLAAKLGMEPAAITRRTCLLIVEAELDGEPVVLAILVDSVSRVIELEAEQLREVPSFGPQVDVAFLIGMARIDDRLVLLLDLRHIVESATALSAAPLLSAIGLPSAEALA